MLVSKLSAVIFVAILLSATASPILYRLRRSLDDSSRDKLSTTELDNDTKQAQFTDNTNEAENSQNKRGRGKRQRKNKALAFFDFIPQFYTGDEYEGEDELSFDQGENTEDDSLSRTIPSRRKQNPYKNLGNSNALSFDNSPIYYIRLPPTPYMFVPGLGYISQPPSLGPPVPAPVNPFINVPIDFVSNGKPTNVYQWAGGPSYQQAAPVDPYAQVFNRPVARPQFQRPNEYDYQRPVPTKKPVSDSKVTSLKKGPYVFNGKPHDSVLVLRDSYNSLYSDALQNFYP